MYKVHPLLTTQDVHVHVVRIGVFYIIDDQAHLNTKLQNHISKFKVEQFKHRCVNKYTLSMPNNHKLYTCTIKTSNPCL